MADNNEDPLIRALRYGGGMIGDVAGLGWKGLTRVTEPLREATMYGLEKGDQLLSALGTEISSPTSQFSTKGGVRQRENPLPPRPRQDMFAYAPGGMTGGASGSWGAPAGAPAGAPTPATVQAAAAARAAPMGAGGAPRAAAPGAAGSVMPPAVAPVAEPAAALVAAQQPTATDQELLARYLEQMGALGPAEEDVKRQESYAKELRGHAYGPRTDIGTQIGKAMGMTAGEIETSRARKAAEDYRKRQEDVYAELLRGRHEQAVGPRRQKEEENYVPMGGE